MPDPAALAKSHWEARRALQVERGFPHPIGAWDSLQAGSQAYLTEAMRRTLEAHGLMRAKTTEELEGQLPLFGEMR